ncbi:MAG TPA: hypothetical protein VH761_15595 [Ilumatobacteraceae bacterium]
MQVIELPTEFEAIVEQLIGRSDGSFDETFVRSLVADLVSRFDDARVRDYVEVLVTKEAADELRRLRGSLSPDVVVSS